VKLGMRIAAAAAALAIMAMGAPLAGADTTWTKISGDYNANIVVPSLGLTGSTAVVAWTQETSPSTSDLNAVSFTTSPTQDVIGAASSKVATGWAQIDFTHALFPAPGGGLQLIFNGIHSTTTGDPLNAMATTLRNPDGSWAAPFAVSGSSAGPTTGVLSGAIPLVSGYATQGIEIFNAAVAHAPGTSDQNLQPQLGGCCGYSPRMALDGAGHLWIAWYSNATGATGIYVQQLDPVTGAPASAPTLAPESESSNNNSFSTNLACGATCRLVYGNSPPAGPANAIVSWWPGQSAPTTIASLAGTSQSAGRVLTAAYRADGRLWIAWYDGKTYRATLGDATGAGGAIEDAGAPTSGAGDAYALSGIAVGDNLLLAANYAWQPTAQLPFAIFVNTVAPLAPVTKAPGPRDVQLQAGPGKSFRIQVQYTMPAACTGAAACTLHAELRTRSGRRLYALAPLPGDGEVVLGTRGRFAVKKGTKGKIRFFIAVTKAQLLKAPFSTEGGSRVAETRLRVWYAPKGSKEALSVRDGRIKVSIARIESGALPGLRGVL
jgi:hypothetical protein